MKVSEIINKTLEWTSGITLQHIPDPVETDGYANTPHEVTQPVSTIIAQGDDVNKPKHPSDIRTNAPSMYPNSQAKE
jgi:hypothetical protein